MKEHTKEKKYPIPELLAPVGGQLQLRAAVNNGADAVYLGGSRFNARAKADNFTLSDLREAIRYAHERNVKVYVTLNTLLKDSELCAALEYADSLYCIGADAVIVQDMGIARLIRKYVPRLPMHLSTQGTVYNVWGVDLMKQFGFTRIVPARELSLQELQRFTAVCHGTEPAMPGIQQKGGQDGASPMTVMPSCEVEVFVHGALCMCYSGQCQMSRILGASGGRASVRSGNRGLCAQPCRLAYTDDAGRTGYFLSPKDLCLLEEIPALCRAGVDSLKIEGRLKSPEYVAVTTSVYRKYLDQYSSTGAVKIDPQDMEDLRRIYNRGGFTTGYLHENPGEKILSGASPKHTGVFAGTVKSVLQEAGVKDPKVRRAVRGAAKKGASLVEVRPAGKSCRPLLAEEDSVEIRPPEAGHKPGHTGSLRAGGRITYRQELAGEMLRIGDMKGSVSPGDEIWQVTDNALLERARATFDAADPAALDRKMIRPVRVKMKFEAAPQKKALLRISDGTAEAEAESETPAEQAVHRPSDPEQIRRGLQKLGGTPLQAEASDITVRLRGDVRIASSEINGMRRRAAEALLQKKGLRDRTPMTEEALRQAEAEISRTSAEETGRGAHDRTGLTQGSLPSDRIPLESFLDGRGGTPEIFPVSKGRLDDLIESRFAEIVSAVKDRGIIIGNAGWILQFLNAGVPVYGAAGLNIFNGQAREACREIGVAAAEDSLETRLPEDGQIPLMITEHPVHSKTLTDRMGKKHEVRRSPSGDKSVIF